jgi:DNA-binding CsgD family transcriptional regulator
MSGFAGRDGAVRETSGLGPVDMRWATAVVHGEAMIAEGIAAALRSYPAVSVIDLSTNLSRLPVWERSVDAVAVDRYLSGACRAADRLRNKGVRVVLLGESEGESDGLTVSTRAPISTLVATLVPQTYAARKRQLTRREGEVLALVASGLTAMEVARRLGISPKTVEQRKSRAFAKLGVANQVAAVRIALMSGQLPWIAPHLASCPAPSSRHAAPAGSST